MNYSEFNGLGLLGQAIQRIGETSEHPDLQKYDDFLEKRKNLDKKFTEFIENKKEKNTEHNSNSMDRFLEYFLNNNNENNYSSIKTLEQRITTFDKAFSILKTEYSQHFSTFLASYDNEEEYPKIMIDYLYMKTMNEFLDRLTNQMDELPKIPKGSLFK
jgi:hypothetical protein